MAYVKTADSTLYNRIVSACESLRKLTDPDGVAKVLNRTYIVGSNLPEDGLTLVTLNPNKAELPGTPLSVACKGWVWDNELKHFIAKTPTLRGDCHHEYMKIKNNKLHLRWIVSKDRRGDPRYHDISYDMANVRFRVEHRGVVARLFWHRSKLYFATGQRLVRVPDDMSTVNPPTEYDTRTYMKKFFVTSGLVASDLFDTSKPYSNVTYNFLYTDPLYSKATYEDTSVPRVTYIGSVTSYDPSILAGIGNVQDICDTTVRAVPKVAHWKDLTFAEANKMLLTGYTNNTIRMSRHGSPLVYTEDGTEIREWDLTGGEPIIVTVRDEKGESMYHVEPSSFWWRSSYHEVMLDTPLARYYKSLVRDPEYLYPAGTLAKLMPQINAGNLTYVKPSVDGDKRESQIICFALSCTRVEQKLIQDAIIQFDKEYKYVLDYLSKTMTMITVGGKGGFENIIHSKSGRTANEYLRSVYEKVSAYRGNLSVSEFIDSELKAYSSYPSLVHKVYIAVQTEDETPNVEPLTI